MECKITIGANKRSYHVEAKDDVARTFVGKRIGGMVSGSLLGLKGYELRITGGSDKDGFPMKREIEGRTRAKVLFSKSGVGHKGRGEGVRERKSVRGNTIAEDIAQINLKVVKGDVDSVGKLLGKPDGKAAEEKTDAKAAGEKGAVGEKAAGDRGAGGKGAEEKEAGKEVAKDVPKKEAKPQEKKAADRGAKPVEGAAAPA